MTGLLQKEKLTFKCTYPDCEWTFKNNYKLQRHLQSHSNEKPYACEHCKKVFSYRYNLNNHLKTHEKKDQEVAFHKMMMQKQSVSYETFPMKCPKKNCTEAFDMKDNLESHLKTHDMKYVCLYEGCMKRFKKPSLLKLHESTHNKQLPFICKYENCDKAFVNQQRLSRHMVIHENKKQFKCHVENCNKTFNHAEYLKVHMRVHDKEKSFTCPIVNCERKFACAGTLKVHLQRHANFRPFKCDHLDCDKTYLTLSNLKAHKKLHVNGQAIRTKSIIHGNKLCKQSDNSTKKTVCVNEFINARLFENTLTNLNVKSFPYQGLTQEDLVTATLGEYICNQYINSNDSDNYSRMSQQETAPTLSQESTSLTQPKNDSLIATDIEDIQFQEEFVTSMYTPAGFTSNKQPNMIGVEESESAFLSPDINELDKLNDNIGVSDSDIDSFETSMELSTGHLVIDGGYFGASSCMPDHIYSNRNLESSSTVNLQDIR